MFFFIITKNLNWEISTKNLVTFKRWVRVNYEKLYYGSSQKNLILGRVGQEKPIYQGRITYKKEEEGGWDSFQI